jgi:hypothetical protein
MQSLSSSPGADSRALVRPPARKISGSRCRIDPSRPLRAKTVDKSNLPCCVAPTHNFVALRSRRRCQAPDAAGHHVRKEALRRALWAAASSSFLPRELGTQPRMSSWRVPPPALCWPASSAPVVVPARQAPP